MMMTIVIATANVAVDAATVANVLLLLFLLLFFLLLSLLLPPFVLLLLFKAEIEPDHVSKTKKEKT